MSLFGREPSDGRAQYALGLQYFTGQGKKKDAAEALKWIRRAAEQNEPDALFFLGSIYHHGEGVSQDFAKAVEYYSEAAKRGHSKAQNNLGSLYADGQGVPVNLSEALRLFRQASENGHVGAQQNAFITERKLELKNENRQINQTVRNVTADPRRKVSEAHLSGGDTDVPPRQDIQFGRLPNSEIQNFRRARNIVFNQERDKFLEAREELTRLFMAGHGEAMSVLGFLAIVAGESDDDIYQGFKILDKCAAAGDAGSSCLIADVYNYGFSVEQDFEKAWSFYTSAIEQGSVSALTSKALMAIEGRGVPRDIEMGKTLLREAEKRGSPVAKEWLENLG